MNNEESISQLPAIVSAGLAVFEHAMEACCATIYRPLAVICNAYWEEAKQHNSAGLHIFEVPPEMIEYDDNGAYVMDNRFDPPQRITMSRLVAPEQEIAIEPPLWIEPEKTTPVLHSMFTACMRGIVNDLLTVTLPEGSTIIATRPVGTCYPAPNDVTQMRLMVYLFFGVGAVDVKKAAP